MQQQYVRHYLAKLRLIVKAHIERRSMHDDDDDDDAPHLNETVPDDLIRYC